MEGMFKLIPLAVLLVAAVVFRRPLALLADLVLGFLDNRLERPGRRVFSESAVAAALLTPALSVLGLFGIAPLFFAIRLSLHDGRGRVMSYVGLEHYRRAFTSEAFWNSFLVTVYYAALTIPVTLALSFALALVLFRVGKGRGFFRTVYFLPYVTSVVAAATVWRVILHPRAGLVNGLLGMLGVPAESHPQWLMESAGALHVLTGGLVPPGVGPSLALCCVVLFEVWHTSGFMIVILLAGLSAIPREYEEAALIDGAGWLRRAWHVTLPLISPTVFFLTVVSVIRAFQAFSSFYALTGNGRGPFDTTQNLTVFIFSNLYEYQRVGYGAAVATLLALAIILLTLLQWRFLGRRVHYE
jgi:multiple sugar transport system permease protein